MRLPVVTYLAENALNVEFEPLINLEINRQVTSLHEIINANPFDGFITSVPAYSTLTIFYEPIIVLNSNQLNGINSFEKVADYVRDLLKTIEDKTNNKARRIEIPVCYGGDFGPDLAEVAELHQLTEDEIINLHSEAVYRVYMIGFVPGFAYLGGLNEKLNTPRKAEPRKKVPAGSVGIGGLQTGIYPFEIPGGWQLIGRTPLMLFDSRQTYPSLLQAGDEVIFKNISASEFSQLSRTAHAD